MTVGAARKSKGSCTAAGVLFQEHWRGVRKEVRPEDPEGSPWDIAPSLGQRAGAFREGGRWQKTDFTGRIEPESF